ncbi:MAG: cation transporter [Eggerthellaceae bacterium]|nr:cation transporter [Eggerthellaceae bacterium]
MDAAQREKAIVRTSIVGIVANVVLVAMKAAVGLMSNSIAIVLDAVNNLTDALSSIVTIIGAKLSNRAPDYKHPLGHGRYEYLSVMVIAAIILYAGISSLIESVHKMIAPEPIDYSPVTLVVVAVGIAVKVALWIYVSRVGKATNSASLRASGADALFDAAISAAVLAAAIVYLACGISLEAYVGALIAVVIVKAGIDMLRETIDDVLGQRPDADLSTGIKRTVCADPDVLGAYDLLLECYGPNLTIGAIHVEVCDVMTAAEIDAMTRRLQAAVLAEHKVVLATVGIYSRNTTNDEIEQMRSTITPVVMNHEGVLQMHGFYVDLDARRLSFDLIISFDVPDRMALYDHIVGDLRELYPDFELNVALDLDLSD